MEVGPKSKSELEDKDFHFETTSLTQRQKENVWHQIVILNFKLFYEEKLQLQ
jgi:hypothetical protein